LARHRSRGREASATSRRAIRNCVPPSVRPAPLPGTPAGTPVAMSLAESVRREEVTCQPRRGFWRRRLVDPILALLTYGVTPDKVAATLAVGTGCSLFPFLGTTSVLNLSVGLALRMNQPILQTLNQLLGPIQLVMILVYVRLGELIWGGAGVPFSVMEMVTSFRDLPLGAFLQRFGWAGVHAFTAWALTLPLLVGALYFGLRPVIRGVAARRRQALRAEP
jgi:uncharacterized protein (DUF2062 family)